MGSKIERNAAIDERNALVIFFYQNIRVDVSLSHTNTRMANDYELTDVIKESRSDYNSQRIHANT